MIIKKLFQSQPTSCRRRRPRPQDMSLKRSTQKNKIPDVCKKSLFSQTENVIEHRLI
jgi:hypothetical protein